MIRNQYTVNNCQKFWNGIISKGMEQALTQMSVSISSVLDELKVINKVDVTKGEINLLFKDGAYFIMFHFFMEYYFYEAYLKTAQLFNSLRADIVKDIKSKYIVLLVLYLIVSILLLHLLY